MNTNENNAVVEALTFNTCNLNYSLVVKIGNLTVHTSLCESQARQVKQECKLSEGKAGEVTEWEVGQGKNSHIIYWQIS